MRKITLFLVSFCMLSTVTFAQKTWKQAKLSPKNSEFVSDLDIPASAQIFSVNINDLQNELIDTPLRGEDASFKYVYLPNPSGEMLKYRVEEAPVFESELQELYPEIRAYVAIGVNDPSSYARFTVTPYNGVNGIILTGDRSKSIVIQDLRDAGKTAVFMRSDRKNRKSFECDTPEGLSVDMNKVSSDYQVQAADDATLRTFVTAISTTGEYAAYHGGTLPQVNAALATSLARINSVYEIDFSITMLLKGNNNNVVFLDGATDPYNSTDDADYNTDLAAQLDLAYPGGAGYDVGHLYAGIGNNGNAGCIGCVCEIVTSGPPANHVHKGSGFTTSTVPIGDRWDVDYVAHEYGHQFGGEHTFNHTPNHSNVSMMEPGSGTTIMGYAGITGATDVQQVSDPYFHAISIQQVMAHAKTRGCDTESGTGNNIPVVNAGANLTLPIGTAFRLTGSATDADGDAITYCWEQYDEENGANAYPDPTATSGDRPLYRSYSPTTSPTRTFPRLADLVANGVNGNTWEKVPTVGRVADFRLTVRDNRAGGAGNDFDDMRVTWTATRGPLEVVSQATQGLIWDGGSTETITWNVNSTNLMGGASNVDILLSTDGGVTFPTVLASNVANDGSETITVPETPAPYCRVMVQPTGAPFFAINTVDFAIDYQVTSTTTCSGPFASGTLNTAIPDGTGANANGPAIGHTINVTGQTGTVTAANGGLKINVDIDHTYVQDLVVQITAPDGSTFMRVWDRTCNGEDNFDITFEDGAPTVACADNATGTFAPAAALSTFDGQSKNGGWNIVVVDFYNGDIGQLNDWSVEFCETVVTETILSTDSLSFDSFNIHPNPNSGNFIINLTSGSNSNIDVLVHDVRGRRVFNNSFSNTGTFNQEVRLDNVSSGMYIVTVTDGERKEVRKILVN